MEILSCGFPLHSIITVCTLNRFQKVRVVATTKLQRHNAEGNLNIESSHPSNTSKTMRNKFIVVVLEHDRNRKVPFTYLIRQATLGPDTRTRTLNSNTQPLVNHSFCFSHRDINDAHSLLLLSPILNPIDNFTAYQTNTMTTIQPQEWHHKGSSCCSPIETCKSATSSKIKTP